MLNDNPAPGASAAPLAGQGIDQNPNPGMLLFLLFTIYQVLNEFEDGIVLIDRENRVRWVNAAMRQFFDLSDCDVAGMPAGVFARTFIAPLVEDADGAATIIAAPRQEERTVRDLPLHLCKPGGEEHWLEYTSRPVNLYPMRHNRLEIYRKITRWKLAEHRLSESEERFRTLFNKGNDAVLVFELSPEYVPTRFVEVNEVACRRLGYTRSELLALSPLDIVPPEKLGEVSAILKRFRLNDRVLFETEHVTKDGRRIPVEINSLHFPLQGRTTVLSISRDVSERRRVEEIRRMSFKQIERNIEQFASLGDLVRQPLQVIVGLTALDDSPVSEEILRQAAVIDGLVDRLDQGWVESEKVRRFLRRHC
ncbi:PAS domain S-box protein [Methanoculleus sp. FWC-SCC1]|uniref:PAS domain S-box protein n=1 Tax=Methanoculleus frigidifontis TaxID=2584085 RepID=A0ABT8M6W3_9EURY|nr:PAS domain S-box protein [Methanoculleus sp. FWC-SCC1]MDN7023677.1 PAS domain S-box protein [Methanoculleus sp. FWC-SCC1]